MLCVDQPVAVGEVFSGETEAGGSGEYQDRSPATRNGVGNGRGLEALYRMSSVKRRGSVLLESDALYSDESPLDQSFYPKAESPDQRGPSTGERNRRFAQESLPLAKSAAVEAIAEAKVNPSKITHLIVVTCTGFYSPGLDVQLIDQLGLSRETQRVQVGFMGCHAAINAMRVARGLIAADPDSIVLLVCVELCTLHYQYGWETDRVVSNAIFADGAAAMVISGSEIESDCHLPKIAATGSKLIADSEDAMSWNIGDHGFEMTLSAEVPGIIEAQLSPFLTQWLARQNLTIREIAGWAVHPGGPRILRSVQTALQLTDDDLAASRSVLASHGNMSSPTMVFIVNQFASENTARPWLMLGFGPGLEVEVALIR
ncbi:MAG TPA: type III polyketide synthase [Planctomycetaceae bacterium]|nr:type III polyketide synthase [Planctomycetaceae bacterium]